MTATIESNLTNDPMSSLEQQPKILCIDDDPEISRALELRFRSYDVSVLRAFHGMQGFWLAMTEQPNLIITDINMPQGNGDYIVECLKRNSETQDIPVLVLSGKRDNATKLSMERLGVETYFTKPCNCDEIISAVSGFIDLQPASE